MDKAFVVLGASSDMGAALLKQIGRNYTWILAQHRRGNEALDMVLEELSAHGVNVNRLTLDLALPDAADTLKKTIAGYKDELTGYEIHMAHFPMIPQSINRFHKIEWDVFEENMNVSVRSFVAASQALIPLMSKAGKGKILAMVSWVAQNVPPRYCADYVMTKYALLGLVKAMAAEYAEKNVTVNGLSPAWVETKYIDNLPEIVKNNHIETSPIHRCMETGEIVPVMEFLLSRGADMITGECIAITGGAVQR